MKKKLLSLLAVPAFALTMFGGAMSVSADYPPDDLYWSHGGTWYDNGQHCVLIATDCDMNTSFWRCGPKGHIQGRCGC